MRVLFLSSDFKPRTGGIAESAYRICRELARRGHHVDIVTHRAGQEAVADDAEPYTVHRVFDEYPLGRLTIGRILKCRRWASHTRAQGTQCCCNIQPDVVVVGNYHFVWGRCLRAWGTPYVQILHGEDIAATLISRYPFRRRCMRRTIEDARWTFFNSGYSRGLAEQLCGRELGFSSVVGCGVSVEDIVVAPDGRAARAELGWDERPVILTVSRLVRRKGIDTTMDALRVVLKSYPDCRYIVAGEGPDRSILERQAGDLCLADKVQFIGRVSAEKKRTLYLASTLYVMPSRAGDAGETEGFGISYLEANALGLAVIGSRAGGIPDAVGHGENGLLVDPHDPVELAEAIVALLGDPERRRRMALAGQDRIRLRFNWMAIVNQIEEKLHDVVVQHGRTTAAIGQSARLTAGRGSSV